METCTARWLWYISSKDKILCGSEADAEKQETGFKELKTEADGRGGDINSGIAVAPIDWVLKEWNMMGANPFLETISCFF